MKTLLAIDVTGSVSEQTRNEFANEINEVIKFSNQPLSDFEIVALTETTKNPVRILNAKKPLDGIKNFINGAGGHLVNDLNHIQKIAETNGFKKVYVFSDILDSVKGLDLSSKLKVEFIVSSTTSPDDIERLKKAAGKNIPVFHIPAVEMEQTLKPKQIKI